LNALGLADVLENWTDLGGNLMAAPMFPRFRGMPASRIDEARSREFSSPRDFTFAAAACLPRAVPF
jgi:hypothetical protein